MGAADGMLGCKKKEIPEMIDSIDDVETISLLDPLGEWEPNVAACSLCAEEFTLTLRRHHCRQCGRCICASCSPYRLHLQAPRAAGSNTWHQKIDGFFSSISASDRGLRRLRDRRSLQYPCGSRSAQ